MAGVAGLGVILAALLGWNPVLVLVSGDISIADTGEVFGNIFDGLSGRNLR